MKRWALLGVGILTVAVSIAYLQAKTFDFKTANLFLDAHANAFEKLRTRTQEMKTRIDNRVFWCKFRIRPTAVKRCVAYRLRHEMLTELANLKNDLKEQMRLNHVDKNNEGLEFQETDAMTHLIESVVKSMESELEKYDMVPVVEAVAKRVM